ncbi:hypothetical protein KA111_01535 [Candidatus Woesebacteria bacterium]|nr:hypothetical protein [Candidatus Woesebacteria bacterium]
MQAQEQPGVNVEKKFSFQDIGKNLDALLARYLKTKSKTHSEEISVVDHDQAQIKDTDQVEARDTTTVLENVDIRKPEEFGDPKIRSVAEMLKNGVEGATQEQIDVARLVLDKLDDKVTKEKAAQLNESPLKKLVEIAEKMGEQNKQLLLKNIEALKEEIFKRILETQQKSLTTSNKLTLEDALRQRLEQTKLSYDSISAPGKMTFTSNAELNDFLKNLLGFDLNVIKMNNQVWKDYSANIDSNQVTGLNIRIYDRVARDTGTESSSENYQIDVYLSFVSGYTPDVLKAAIIQSFEEKKPKEVN